MDSIEHNVWKCEVCASVDRWHCLCSASLPSRRFCSPQCRSPVGNKPQQMHAKLELIEIAIILLVNRNLTLLLTYYIMLYRIALLSAALATANDAAMWTVGGPVLSLRACVDVCGAAGGTPACATALALTQNVTTPCSSLTSSGSCGFWLGHHRRQFGGGDMDRCLATPTAEPAAPVAPPGRFIGSSYGIPGDCCILSAGELFEAPCDYHSNFESAATYLSCLCESHASANSTAGTVAWLDAWTVADLDRRRAYLVPAILMCAALALIPWLILRGCSTGSLRGCCPPAARHTAANEQDEATGAPSRRLRDASFVAARVHARIKRSMLGLGWTMICFGLLHTVMWPFSGIRGVLEPILGPYTWAFVFEFGGILPLMLSIQPTDELLIRLTSLFISTFLLGFGVLGVLLIILSPSAVGKVAWGIAASFLCLTVLSLVPTLRCDKHGRRVMQPRAVLRRLWLVMRVLFLACGVLLVGFGWLIQIALYGEINPTQFGRGFAGAVMFVGWGACSHRNRGRVHRWLGSLGASGTQEQEAAALASLISRGSRGGGGVAEALTMAAGSFRVLPLGRLEPDDLASNVDTGLNARVRRADLGDCDAFISHSWQDDGEQKYRRLERHVFASAERTIWLDKVENVPILTLPSLLTRICSPSSLPLPLPPLLSSPPS